eukprot:2122036-Lingulodinium_polyedra.AAC.1
MLQRFSLLRAPQRVAISARAPARVCSALTSTFLVLRYWKLRAMRFDRFALCCAVYGAGTMRAA